MSATSETKKPDVSFVLPCYNEVDVVGYTVPQLAEAFEARGWKIELVCVENGSTDGTGRVLERLKAEGRPVVHVKVEKNQGYGFGIISGLPHASAAWIGMIPADGQVDAEDVVRLFEAVRVSRSPVVGKVRRRFRMDGFLRKIVSIVYNIVVFCLYPRLGSVDVNGSPKILPRHLVPLLELSERRWFLDPELMIKAHELGVRVLEVNVFARMRSNGLSHVRPSACWEFFRDLLRYRFGSVLSPWRRSIADRKARAAQMPEPAAAPHSVK